MFSNLASYIFGSTVEEAEPVVTSTASTEVVSSEAVADKAASGEEEEWVLVGDAPPALNLGSMSDVLPRPALGSTGSSNPSIDSEDSGDSTMDEGAAAGPAGDAAATAAANLTRSGRRLAVPFGSLPAGSATVAEIRTVRAAQSLKVKDAGRHVTAKALERRNKAVKVASASSAVSRKGKAPTVALRAAGTSRHLKQC